MLSALGEAENRIAGLSQGADDYLGKPFEPEELILRLGSLWRRSGALNTPQHPSLPTIGSYTYDTQRALLTGQGEAISLTPQEKTVLDMLLSHEGKQVDRHTLQGALTGENNHKEDYENRSLDIYITRLRRKIEPDPKTPRFLLTIRGGGYKLLLDKG
jgi:two-component system phosphate regulon response regulator OmpR